MIFEGRFTLSLGTIFAHMLPMCSFALSRAKGRPSTKTKTKTVVPLSTVQLAIKDCTKNLKDILKNHSGRSSAYNKLQLLSGRVKQAIEKGALEIEAANEILMEADSACGKHTALLNETRLLQGAVPLWNSATYEEGMGHVRTLNNSVSESSRHLEALSNPVAKLIDKAKKKGLAVLASKRWARMSLVRQWEVHGLSRNWLNLLIDLKIVSEHSEPVTMTVPSIQDQVLPSPSITEKMDEDNETETDMHGDRAHKSDNSSEVQVTEDSTEDNTAVAKQMAAGSTSCSSGTVEPNSELSTIPLLPKPTAKAICNYVSNMTSGWDARASWWRLPAHWDGKAINDEKDCVWSILAFLNAASGRVDAASATLVKCLGSANWIPPSGCLMTRLGPRGADLDEYAKQQWVPVSMRNAGVVPECLLTFGCPVLIGHCPYGFRSTMCELPAYGMGKFILGLTGSFALFTWPMTIATGMAVQPRDAVAWMGTVPSKQFVEYTRELLHMMVGPGSVVWIPPCWSELIVSLDQCSTALVIPFYSSVMVRALSAETSEIVQRECTVHAESLKSDPNLSQCGSGLTHWLDGLAQ